MTTMTAYVNLGLLFNCTIENHYLTIFKQIKNNTMSRQDSKSSQSSNEQASMIISMSMESSLETTKVVTDNKHVNRK